MPACRGIGDSPYQSIANGVLWDMSLSPIVPLQEETNAVAYRKAHTGKLMIIRRAEGEPTVAGDFFEFDSVGTHPSGLLVTGIFQNDRRDHMMASRVRAASEAEITWRNSSPESRS
jgi:hypothetical protein